MIQGIERVWELPGSKGGMTVEVAVSEQYDTLQNTSDLTVGLRVKSSRYYHYTYYLKGSLVLEGTQLVQMQSVVPTHYVQLPAQNTYDPVKKWSADYTDSPWTLQGIPHETDGSKTVTLAIDLKGYTGDGTGGSGWSVDTVLEIPLTHIPRASTVSATDGPIGGESIITVTRRSGEYTHSLGLEFGEIRSYLQSDGIPVQQEQKFANTTIQFPIPMEFYTMMPDCATMPCHLICTTYWGDTQIGEPQVTDFTVTASRELFSPTVVGTVEDISESTIAVTGDPSVLVRHMSRIRCDIAPVAGMGASIASLTINGTELPAGELSMTFDGNCGSSFRFGITDSRGYTAEHVVMPHMIPYVIPSSHVRAVRLEPTGDQVMVTVSGACFTGSFGAKDNQIAAQVTVNGGEPLSMPLTAEANAFRGQLLLTGLDYRRSHTVRVQICDRLMQVFQELTVEKGLPVFDWGERDFRFHVPVTVPMLNGHANIALAAYPVGAIFASEDPTDPGITLGGAWEALETDLPFYLWKRVRDDGAVLGTAVLGIMKL